MHTFHGSVFLCSLQALVGVETYAALQAISVIVTHCTDDLSKLPPRIPVNAPKPRAKPAEANRPKLRLNQTAHATTGAAPDGLAPGPCSPDQDAVMAEVDAMSDRVGEVGGSNSPAQAAATAVPASPEASGAGTACSDCLYAQGAVRKTLKWYLLGAMLYARQWCYVICWALLVKWADCLG